MSPFLDHEHPGPSASPIGVRIPPISFRVLFIGRARLPARYGSRGEGALIEVRIHRCRSLPARYGAWGEKALFKVRAYRCRSLPACYEARGERARVEVRVHRCRFSRNQVGRSAGWLVDKRRHRRSRGHRKGSLGNGRLGRFLEENGDKRPWWMTTSRPESREHILHECDRHAYHRPILRLNQLSSTGSESGFRSLIKFVDKSRVFTETGQPRSPPVRRVLKPHDPKPP